VQARSTERDWQALKVLWRRRAKETSAKLPKRSRAGGPRAYTTVLSLLQVMEQKGLVGPSSRRQVLCVLCPRERWATVRTLARVSGSRLRTAPVDEYLVHALEGSGRPPKKSQIGRANRSSQTKTTFAPQERQGGTTMNAWLLPIEAWLRWICLAGDSRVATALLNAACTARGGSRVMLAWGDLVGIGLGALLTACPHAHDRKWHGSNGTSRCQIRLRSCLKTISRACNRFSLTTRRRRPLSPADLLRRCRASGRV